MLETVLNKIVHDKIHWISTRSQQQPLAGFQNQIVPSDRNFYRALQGDKPAFILECKKASPSRGLIRKDFDPVEIAKVYRDFAAVISVLTDEKYFQGSFDFLPQVSQTVSQPVLCKDFIIDPYQIYLARYYQADAILLMLSVLTDEQYRQLAAVAHQLNMGVLTEVINEEELQRAVQLGARVIGINNRDLRDLSIDLDRTRSLAPRIPQDITVISESGINHYHQLRELSQYANGFLIGSALMSEANLRNAVCRVILGDNKVCGLTRPQDASAAYQAGANYGGLIFVSHSARYVNIDHARRVMAGAPLKYVGVFCDAPIDDIVETVSTLGLHAVQLHGVEDQTYIDTLREKLPPASLIWKALSVHDHLPARSLRHVDRYLLDNGAGGTGKCFDWSLLREQKLDNVMLAGGLNADNCVDAALLGCVGLDFNSGVESQPGIKEASLIFTVFKKLRTY